MYSSSSSSQQRSSSSTQTNPNLMRYDSAPSSLLSHTVDSVIGDGQHHQFFSEFTQSRMSLSGGESSRNTLSLKHQPPYNETDSSPKTTSSNLIRHSSSPAGFLSHLASDIGYSGAKGYEANYNEQGTSNMMSRLGPQLSFTRKDHHSLSQISEVSDCVLQGIENSNRKRSANSQNSRSSFGVPATSGFSLSTWDESNDNNFIISNSSNKRGKAINDDMLNGLSALDPQYAMALEMSTIEKLMQVPQDSVPCKIRAKRGCATHPRSIAERERRTRISGKLKKLQDLVPNMDKQTSYSDMLDLAVQHIKGLQTQIEKLNNELDHCTCGCKAKTHSS
ncbi:transcription factor bHLH128-like isoform X2 [Amaranthus tricolor]|uniref:transcription factor bHLH128-like isoform X2 n=1 Tax=Amaranthus tricolor TaxID=29722 RepID=UPI00258B45FA|nr:transcription factor bHLH128-like isoform X2 [Amaranthus tricolor]